MKPISLVLTGLVLALLSTAAYSQSLADLAKKEKERREALKKDTKVITNEQAAKYQTGPITTATNPPADAQAAGTEKPATEGESKDAAAGTDKSKATGDEPVDLQGRPESYWRQTFADARQRVKDLENESNVLVLRFNELQNKFYSTDDGFKRQEVQREIQKTLYMQDVNKENLAKAKTDLVDLEKEAHKSGALPGWLREEKK